MKRNTFVLPVSIALAAVSLFGCKKELISPTDDTATHLLSAEASSSASKAAVSLTGWMGQLADNTQISRLSIPGTHDSGARFEPIGGTAKCQELTIAEQLNAGTRFLDIRCRHIGDAFAIHHGAVYQNMNFTDVLNACYSFLNEHPTETIVMSVKEEHTATNNTRSFEQTFDSYVQQQTAKWYLQAGIPNLGQVRGKIVLLRRFGAGNTPKGIDATNWADNTTFSINNPAASLRIQDQYQVPDNNAKWNNLTNLFSEAKSGNQQVLYINYASGYKPLIFGIPSITTVSNAINPNLKSYFTTNIQGRFGIIPMDFAVAERNTLIINTNF
ncbi:phosphatidylinositol-specific phospholipase C [Chitinophaga nivalis]|uniref:1-phosphatidylinositol phosphodiesterase n=1 Tax=Chitinophaga nivalis TaxID=2991709 RepID=A0ABT3IE97_9BACT|nr:phosphatidylinositol-specific phospholipase C [Chitinophaga nivalis]MCW3468021.1 phosphatidylinositol-specific phospholipase C [Chitinophaga nivalis]MCW3482288.1 phosphatidylinositol-specific phospholipase C [Chitinophaga nivalis]